MSISIRVFCPFLEFSESFLIHISDPTNTTIGSIKESLVSSHPSKPDRNLMKLIHAGKLLADDNQLLTSLVPIGESSIVLHLVPGRSVPSNEQLSKTTKAIITNTKPSSNASSSHNIANNQPQQSNNPSNLYMVVLNGRPYILQLPSNSVINNHSFFHVNNNNNMVTDDSTSRVPSNVPTQAIVQQLPIINSQNPQQQQQPQQDQQEQRDQRPPQVPAEPPNILLNAGPGGGLAFAGADGGIEDEPARNQPPNPFTLLLKLAFVLYLLTQRASNERAVSLITSAIVIFIFQMGYAKLIINYIKSKFNQQQPAVVPPEPEVPPNRREVVENVNEAHHQPGQQLQQEISRLTFIRNIAIQFFSSMFLVHNDNNALLDANQ